MIIDLPEAAEEQTPTPNTPTIEEQIEAIKEQHKHCDIEARIDPDGKLRILSVNARQGSSVFHDNPTVVTIVNCDPPKVNQCSFNEGAKPVELTQEQLKAIFAHVTNMTDEQTKDLGYSLTAKTNFPRIELQIVSFSKYGNNTDEWKCTIVHQSPTDPKHEQYSFQSTHDFETTCHRLWWPVKCEGDEVEESQQQFVSIPVSEFEGIKSQIKELIELNETRKSETEQLRKWLERVVSALQMK